MRLRTLLGEVLPILGTIGLLGLWLYQQTGIESRSVELRQLSNARTIYQTYQSHNAVFNAINESIGDSKASGRLRTFQVYNYELGLQALEAVLPAEQKRDIPPAVNAYDGTATFEEKMARTQQRLELLQTRLATYESTLRRIGEEDRKKYLILYVLISTISIMGAACKVLDRLQTAAGG